MRSSFREFVRRAGASRLGLAIGAFTLVLLLLTSSFAFSSYADRGAFHRPPRLRPMASDLAPRASALSSQPLAWSPAPPFYLIGEGAGLATTANRVYAVLFGGITSSLSNSTSIYDETTNSWSGPITTVGWPPSPRAHFAFAADPLPREDFLFGGETDLSRQFTDNQTWTFNTSTHVWRQVNETSAPAPRQDPAFAVAPYLGTGLLFGGWNQSYGSGTYTYRDTWSLNLSSGAWTPVSPSGGVGPPSLHGASMLWDPTTHRFELFGGCDPCSNSVWSYDPWNTTWTLVATGSVPSPRDGAVWVYDPVQRLDVLFGGDSSTGPLLDAWTYNATLVQWSNDPYQPGPSARYASAATWIDNPSNETLLVAGGNNGMGSVNDMWRFAPTSDLNVQMLDASTHLPIVSGLVTVDGTTQSNTNAHGYGNQTQVPSGGTLVTGSKVGYHPANGSLWIRPGITPRLVYLNLTPNPHANLTVHVNSTGHLPLGGIDVNVTVNGNLWRNPPLQTNSFGYVYYSGIPAGVPFLLTAWQQGYHENRSVLVLNPDQNRSVNYTLYELPELVLRTWGNDTSSLLGAYPFPGALVALNGSAAGASGPGGWMNLSLNQTGTFRTLAMFSNCANGYDNVTLPYTGVVWANDTLRPWALTGVHVHVVSNLTKNPIAGADVNDTYSNGLQRIQVPTDGLGDSNSSAIRAGPNLIAVWTPGYYEKDYRVFLYPGPTLFLNVSLVPLPSLTLRTYGLDVHNRTVVLSGVTIFWNAAYSGLTNLHGYLNFTPARAGSVQFYAVLPDYRPGWLNLTVNATGHQWANLTLVHLPWAILTVQALDRSNDRPLAGALLLANMPDGTTNSTSANAHGFGNMTDVVGKASASANVPDYYPALGTATLLQYRSVLLRLFLVPFPVVHIKVYGYNLTSGLYLLSGAQVQFNGTFVGFTNAHGWLNVSSFSGGVRVIRASALLYFSETKVEALNYTGQLNVSFFLLEKTFGQVRVHLRDLYTGLSVPAAAVNLTNFDPTPTTAGGSLPTPSSGWANFTDVGLGNYTLTAYHSGYHLSPTIVLRNFTWGQVAWENVSLWPFPYATIYAEVRDRNTSAPISGALVLIGDAYSSLSNSAGNATFPLPDVPGGFYEVIASARGYYDWYSNGAMDFPGGHHTDLTIWLLPAPKRNCTSPSEPGCIIDHNGTYTKGNFSLLPFAAGPWWPFLLLPPLFLLGALAYFVVTRKREEGRRPPGVVLLPSAPPTMGPRRGISDRTSRLERTEGPSFGPSHGSVTGPGVNPPEGTEGGGRSCTMGGVGGPWGAATRTSRGSRAGARAARPR
ncbi:MAG: hypothetical protein KGJ23_07445 [Euryarchaeota archaeon]|nr:hypothetical protein [Euryarchaeota archaeon]MDE1836433.1 hypothetical protein [Euryarchaeota archaeon]MDE1879052.1 hypothetical protein [Euryarchaeota archaeon]MDE2044181.1 hypothetical protein [Thermoplasmata archaeon]